MRRDYARTLARNAPPTVAAAWRKRQRMGAGGASEKPEVKWVCCDQCNKWRTLPESADEVDPSMDWFCDMHPSLSCCGDEQSSDEEAEANDISPLVREMLKGPGGEARGVGGGEARTKEQDETQADRWVVDDDAPAGGGANGRPWSPEEDTALLEAVATCGLHWDLIVRQLAALGTGRTSAMCRNRYQRLNAPLKANVICKNKCKKCGQLKRGHTCTFVPPPPPPQRVEHSPPEEDPQMQAARRMARAQEDGAADPIVAPLVDEEEEEELVIPSRPTARAGRAAPSLAPECGEEEGQSPVPVPVPVPAPVPVQEEEEEEEEEGEEEQLVIPIRSTKRIISRGWVMNFNSDSEEDEPTPSKRPRVDV
jgi:ribosomal protein L32